jgi:hypothetical protein
LHRKAAVVVLSEPLKAAMLFKIKTSYHLHPFPGNRFVGPDGHHGTGYRG